jgi:hypothetical protein
MVSLYELPQQGPVLFNEKLGIITLREFHNNLIRMVPRYKLLGLLTMIAYPVNNSLVTHPRLHSSLLRCLYKELLCVLDDEYTKPILVRSFALT